MKLIRLTECNSEEILAAEIMNRADQEVFDDFEREYRRNYSASSYDARLLGVKNASTPGWGHNPKDKQHVYYDFLVLSNPRYKGRTDQVTLQSFSLWYDINKDKISNRLQKTGEFSVWNSSENVNDTKVSTTSIFTMEFGYDDTEISRTYDNEGSRDLYDQVRKELLRIYRSSDIDVVHPSYCRNLKSLIKSLDNKYRMIHWNPRKLF